MGLKELLGEELYNQVKEKIGEKELGVVNDGSYVPRARLNEVSEKLKAYEGKVSSYEEQISKTKDLLKNNEELKASYSDLNSKFEQEIQAKDREILNVKKSTLVKERLINEGAKHTSLLMKEIDLDKLSLDSDNLIGIDDTISGLKKNYEDLFSTKQVKNNDSTAGNSKDDDDDASSYAKIFGNI